MRSPNPCKNQAVKECLEYWYGFWYQAAIVSSLTDIAFGMIEGQEIQLAENLPIALEKNHLSILVSDLELLIIPEFSD